ncbi:hypothetical protein C8R43DRAFT_944850 [Mycena crocata]|nr:hypothetical protein C8R43DRAFT_944850 [Mycena crocata]
MSVTGYQSGNNDEKEAEYDEEYNYDEYGENDTHLLRTMRLTHHLLESVEAQQARQTNVVEVHTDDNQHESSRRREEYMHRGGAGIHMQVLENFHVRSFDDVTLRFDSEMGSDNYIPLIIPVISESKGNLNNHGHWSGPDSFQRIELNSNTPSRGWEDGKNLKQ